MVLRLVFLPTLGLFVTTSSGTSNNASRFYLESNYDEEMLENSRYPIHLKKRIRGGQGHLSNRQALELFIKHRPPFMSHVLLSHL